LLATRVGGICQLAEDVTENSIEPLELIMSADESDPRRPVDVGVCRWRRQVHRCGKAA
jgi:hypothetical protein